MENFMKSPFEYKMRSLWWAWYKHEWFLCTAKWKLDTQSSGIGLKRGSARIDVGRCNAGLGLTFPPLLPNGRNTSMHHQAWPSSFSSMLNYKEYESLKEKCLCQNYGPSKFWNQGLSPLSLHFFFLLCFHEDLRTLFHLKPCAGQGWWCSH